MSTLEEAKRICTEQLLVPFESYATKLSNGDCAAYPDPASKLAGMSKADISKLTNEEFELFGRPWTIGYGSTFDENGLPIRPGDIWTHDRAIRVKQITLDKFLSAMLVHSPGLIQENSYKIAAVLSWVYNCGIGNYRVSTFRRKINEKEWEDAAKECIKWNKAAGKVLRGLTRRREAEAKLLLM